jgi:hypothetical protein
MKKFSRVLFLGLAFTAFAAVKSNAQIVVSVRPEVPHEYVNVRRPPAPSPRHVWVEAGWTAQGGRYVYRPGYWALPPSGRTHWVPGHWRTRADGRTLWARGHWS